MITIDKASVLCLDKRLPEREEDVLNMKAHFEAMGTDFNVFLAGCEGNYPIEAYDYWDEEDPDVSGWGYGIPGLKHHHYNAFGCHMKMLRRAKYEGRENLLMLEDDAYVTDRFTEIWDIIKLAPVLQDYDLLYLGWWVGDEHDQWNLQAEQNWKENGVIDIVNARQVGGLHGCLVHNRMFDTLLNLPQNNPVDYQLNARGGHDHLNSYIVLPKIIHTRTTFSYCEGSVINRKHL